MLARLTLCLFTQLNAIRSILARPTLSIGTVSGHLVKQPIGACWASSSRFNGHRKPVSLQQHPIPVRTRAQSVAFTASHRIASRHSLSILYCRAVTLYVRYLLCMHGTEPRTQHCGSLPFPSPALSPPSQRSPTNLGSGFKHNTASHSTVPHTSIHHQRVCMYVCAGIACRASCRSVRLEAQQRDRLIFSVLAFFLFRYVSYTYTHTYATTDCTTPNFMRTLDRTAK